jgi:hypothetical protein
MLGVNGRLSITQNDSMPLLFASTEGKTRFSDLESKSNGKNGSIVTRRGEYREMRLLPGARFEVILI